MPTEYGDIAWFPVCVLLSVAGAGATVLVARRRGWGSAVRMLSLALLPLGLYWSGLLRLLWSISEAVVRFATGLVLSPLVSVGLGLLALSVALWLGGGVLKRRGIGRAARPAVEGDRTTVATRPGQAAAKPPGQAAAKPRGRAAAGGEFDEVEELLRRRGIT